MKKRRLLRECISLITDTKNWNFNRKHLCSTFVLGKRPSNPHLISLYILTRAKRLFRNIPRGSLKRFHKKKTFLT